MLHFEDSIPLSIDDLDSQQACKALRGRILLGPPLLLPRMSVLDMVLPVPFRSLRLRLWTDLRPRNLLHQRGTF